MSKVKVIIAGGGIAGPVLAMFLKQKGYEPVIHERLEGVTDAGLSLCLQPNGLRVLAQIPGLVDSLTGRSIKKLLFYSILPEDKGVLAESSIPSKLKEHYGFGMFGVNRTAFHQSLVEHAQKNGVQFFWGHQLDSLEQGDDSVTVTFSNGETDTGSFVIGCDGLHSGTRIALFGKGQADFTGLVQMGGMSPTPAPLLEHPALTNIYGNGEHLITYPVSKTHNSWAITLRELEAKETWKAMDKEAQQKFKEGPFSTWDNHAGDLVRNAEKVIKYGLYDRPELESWHVGRVALLGDAAHPTSPHLGQGANQAFEDIALLVRLFEEHNPSAAPPSTATLSKIFHKYEKVRIPRSAALVKEARQQGESRVVAGVPACLKRNDDYRKDWGDDETIVQHFGRIYE